MLAAAEVDRLVLSAAQRVVTPGLLARVYSEPMLASDGKDALRIVVVYSANENPAADGDVGLDTIIGVRKALVEAGEERFPIIDFSTELEESQDVDPQS